MVEFPPLIIEFPIDYGFSLSALVHHTSLKKYLHYHLVAYIAILNTLHIISMKLSYFFEVFF